MYNVSILDCAKLVQYSISAVFREKPENYFSKILQKEYPEFRKMNVTFNNSNFSRRKKLLMRARAVSLIVKAMELPMTLLSLG